MTKLQNPVTFAPIYYKIVAYVASCPYSHKTLTEMLLKALDHSTTLSGYLVCSDSIQFPLRQFIALILIHLHDASMRYDTIGS